MSASQVDQTLDHLFRRQFGQMVAYLTRFFGADHLDLAEAVVQEALLKAAQTWPLQGIPDRPEAWILRAAKNGAIDHIRKSRDLPHEAETLESLVEASRNSHDDETLDESGLDDQLKLMFICCHPKLPHEARIALTLKTLCGFSVKEIARAFLAKEETIAQRLVRAKNKVAELGLKFEVPPESELAARIDAVQEVLYLMFNEGYLATSGEALVRRDLCEEAIYRATALAHHPLGSRPAVLALLALMHFQISRFDSRTDAHGELLLLEEQDRAVWDQAHIGLGMRYLGLAAEGEELTTYHLQAGIASCHALAASFDQTDWRQILGYYDLLLWRENSPIVALNRAVAVAMAEGWASGLLEIEKIKDLPPLKSYYLLFATRAELLRRQGDLASAKENFEQARSLVGTTPERRLLDKRIRECETRRF